MLTLNALPLYQDPIKAYQHCLYPPLSKRIREIVTKNFDLLTGYVNTLFDINVHTVNQIFLNTLFFKMAVSFYLFFSQGNDTRSMENIEKLFTMVISPKMFPHWPASSTFPPLALLNQGTRIVCELICGFMINTSLRIFFLSLLTMPLAYFFPATRNNPRFEILGLIAIPLYITAFCCDMIFLRPFVNRLFDNSSIDDVREMVISVDSSLAKSIIRGSSFLNFFFIFFCTVTSSVAVHFATSEFFELLRTRVDKNPEATKAFFKAIYENVSRKTDIKEEVEAQFIENMKIFFDPTETIKVVLSHIIQSGTPLTQENTPEFLRRDVDRVEALRLRFHALTAGQKAALHLLRDDALSEELTLIFEKIENPAEEKTPLFIQAFQSAEPLTEENTPPFLHRHLIQLENLRQHYQALSDKKKETVNLLSLSILEVRREFRALSDQIGRLPSYTKAIMDSNRDLGEAFFKILSSPAPSSTEGIPARRRRQAVRV